MKKIERKLKNSLAIEIPNQFHKKATSRLFAYVVYAVFLFLIGVAFTKPNVFLNDGDLEYKGEVSVIGVSLASRMIYPWQESDDQYTYENNDNSFFVIIQDGQEKYQLNMMTGYLQDSDKATSISNVDVYFYIVEDGYVARWQYRDYIVTVTTKESLSNLICKVKTIMKENLI